MAPAKSSVFDHYEVRRETADGFIGKCKHCGISMKGSRKATTNLLNHMKVRISSKLPEIFSPINS